MSIYRREFLKSGALTLLALTSLHREAIAATVRGLKDAYKSDFLVGTAVDEEVFIKGNQALIDIVKKDFNSVTAGNIFKWDNIHPTVKHWNWTYTDEFVKFGLANHLDLVGHSLVWHFQVPPNIFHNVEKPEAAPAIRTKLETHVHTIVDRYKGKIRTWEVVSEVLHETQGWFLGHWYKALGKQFVVDAFQHAHEADPSATLLYTDFGLSHPAKRFHLVEMIHWLKKQKTPIHGIALQGHFGLEYPDLNELEKTINVIISEGLRIHFSELDVDVLPTVPEDRMPVYDSALDPWRDGLPKEIEDKLTRRYEAIFKLFLKYKNHIDRVNFWGISDRESWKNDFPVPGRTNYPLLFDRKLKPKQAYHAVLGMK